MTQAIATPQSKQQASDKAAIRPFRFEAPEADLIELRRRIKATRFPEHQQQSRSSERFGLRSTFPLAQEFWNTITAK